MSDTGKLGIYGGELREQGEREMRIEKEINFQIHSSSGIRRGSVLFILIWR